MPRCAPMSVAAMGRWPVEWPLRLCAIATYVLAVVGLCANWLDSGRPPGLLLLMLSELFTLGLIVFARRATLRDATPTLVLAVAFTSGYFLLMETADTVRLAPAWFTGGLQVVGLSLAFVAKAALGRAFGILPAARALVSRGPYRWVRHPMYLGYLLSNAGFLLAYPSLRNALVTVAVLLVQVLRILREESVMARSVLREDWQRYRLRVPARLLPGVF